MILAEDANHPLRDCDRADDWYPVTAAGGAAPNVVITWQAEIIAYIEDYKLLMIATLAALPLLIIFKRSTRPTEKDHSIAIE